MSKIKSVTTVDMLEQFYGDHSYKDPHKIYFRMRSCNSKKTFATKEKADNKIKNLCDADMHSYKCRFCGLWHIGH